MGWKTVPIWKTSPLPSLLITVKVIVFEKVSVSDIQNRKSGCYGTDCRWEALSA